MDSRAAIRSQELRAAAFFVEEENERIAKLPKGLNGILEGVRTDLGELAHRSHQKGGE